MHHSRAIIGSGWLIEAARKLVNLPKLLAKILDYYSDTLWVPMLRSDEMLPGDENIEVGGGDL